MRHPLHPVFVHFPVACWSLAVVTDFASLWVGQTAWSWSGGLLAVGSATAVVAMLSGLVELVRVPEGAPMRDAWLHMGAMLTAFTFFVSGLMLRLDDLQTVAPDVVSLVLDAGGIIALAIGGWFGGRLVYGHGIGGN